MPEIVVTESQFSKVNSQFKKKKLKMYIIIGPYYFNHSNIQYRTHYLKFQNTNIKNLKEKKNLKLRGWGF